MHPVYLIVNALQAGIQMSGCTIPVHTDVFKNYSKDDKIEHVCKTVSSEQCCSLVFTGC